jgi:hypothetical protein
MNAANLTIKMVQPAFQRMADSDLQSVIRFSKTINAN